MIKNQETQIDWRGLVLAIVNTALWLVVIYFWVYDQKKTAVGIIVAGLAFAVVMQENQSKREKLDQLGMLALVLAFISIVGFAYYQLLQWDWPIFVFAVIAAVVGVVVFVLALRELSKTLALAVARKLAPKLAAWIEREDARLKAEQGKNK